ncbi:MAG: class I SAM-dependent methyltransferase [Acidobacteria bacterium]|nr:class I SAM-dependent methyltransferase [Acidobacteriota bacterium]
MSADVWDDGAAYEPYVGRWSRLVAREFVRWLDLPPGSAWLDFGCGTGALTETLLTHASPRLVVGCDRSPGYIDFACRHANDPRARFQVVELSDVPQVDGGFDACVTGLVLNFLPSPEQGIAVLASRARRGGTIAAYVWDYGAGMELMRVFWDAATALDPAAKALDEGVRFPLCRPDPLRQLFEGAGLQRVDVQPIDVPTVFRDFDDYWRPFLGGQAPAPGYAMSLSAEQRDRLRDAIRARLAVAPDGRIPLRARAWAVRGIAV